MTVGGVRRRPVSTAHSSTGHVLKRLHELRGRCSDVVGDVRGKGLMLDVELIEPGTQKLEQNASQRTKQMGVLFGKGGCTLNFESTYKTQ